MTGIRAPRVASSAIVLFAFALLFAACGDVDDTGPAIESMTIEPDTISQSATGMTDEFFNVTIVTSGFTEPIDADATEVFIQQDGDIVGTPESVDVQGNTILVNRIAKSWFQNLPPGAYEIGAQVNSVPDEVTGRPIQSVRELDLATVTVTQ